MNAFTFEALAEPNRLRIVELLRERPASVGAIAEGLALRQPQVSKHLHTLAEAGLVSVHPKAQKRIYALQPGPFRELGGWAESFRRLLERNYDRLEGLLAGMMIEEQENQTPQAKKRKGRGRRSSKRKGAGNEH